MNDECGRELSFDSSSGEDETTFYCDLPKGHIGKHQEKSRVEIDEKCVCYTITWGEPEGEEL